LIADRQTRPFRSAPHHQATRTSHAVMNNKGHIHIYRRDPCISPSTYPPQLAFLASSSSILFESCCIFWGMAYDETSFLGGQGVCFHFSSYLWAGNTRPFFFSGAAAAAQ